VLLLDKPAGPPAWDASEDLAAMLDFLNTTACRREVLGSYLDGEAMGCRMLGAELCDRCQGGPTASRRADQDVQLGLRSTQQAVWQEQSVVGSLEDRLAWARELCPLCLVLDGEAAARGHTFGECRGQEGLSKGTYSVFRRRIKFENFTCCFKCAAPQTVCLPQRTGACLYQDVILPVCFAWWRSVSLGGQRWLRRLQGPRPTTDKEFAGWLGRSTRWNDVQVVYAVALFDLVVERLQSGGSPGANLAD
jgi:hypothetical protein